jgi:hypothetical protein
LQVLKVGDQNQNTVGLPEHSRLASQVGRLDLAAASEL